LGIEAWNEPNLRASWAVFDGNGKWVPPTPAQLAELTDRVRAGIAQAGSASAGVLTIPPSMSPVGHGINGSKKDPKEGKVFIDGVNLTRDMLDAMSSSLKNHVATNGAISLHLYDNNNRNDGGNKGVIANFDHYITAIRNAFANRMTPTPPKWITEVGFPSVKQTDTTGCDPTLTPQRQMSARVVYTGCPPKGYNPNLKTQTSHMTHAIQHFAADPSIKMVLAYRLFNHLVAEPEEASRFGVWWDKDASGPITWTSKGPVTHSLFCKLNLLQHDPAHPLPGYCP
jgi:hypothetical protein